MKKKIRLPNKIVIASFNKGKLVEIKQLFKNTKVSFIAVSAFTNIAPEENGKTFIENSEIKADFYCKKTNIVTIADDSGLEIDCLNGMPGIFSSRWADQYGGFENAMLEILKKPKAQFGNPILKTLGSHSSENKDITVHEGKYGPYVKCGKINASLL